MLINLNVWKSFCNWSKHLYNRNDCIFDSLVCCKPHTFSNHVQQRSSTFWNAISFCLSLLVISFSSFFKITECCKNICRSQNDHFICFYLISGSQAQQQKIRFLSYFPFNYNLFINCMGSIWLKKQYHCIISRVHWERQRRNKMHWNRPRRTR